MEKYHREGRLDMYKFDESIVKDLDACGPEGAVRALELFCEVDASGIRNQSGFLKVVDSVSNPTTMLHNPLQPTVFAPLPSHLSAIMLETCRPLCSPQYHPQPSKSLSNIRHACTLSLLQGLGLCHVRIFGIAPVKKMF